MIFQFRFDNANIVNGVKIINQTLPFSGRCIVKIIRIDVSNNLQLAASDDIMRLTSDQFFNSTPLSGQIFFLNNANNYYGDNFIFECDLPQNITFTLLDIPQSYDGLIMTVDIKPITNNLIY